VVEFSNPVQSTGIYKKGKIISNGIYYFIISKRKLKPIFLLRGTGKYVVLIRKYFFAHKRQGWERRERRKRDNPSPVKCYKENISSALFHRRVLVSDRRACFQHTLPSRR